jgi:hypothetical protein
MVSSQGVRQLCPEGVFTSAPAGSVSNRTAAVGGDEFRKFRLGTDAEQAATVNPHAMTAMTRLIITPQLWRLRAAIPQTRPCRTAREGSTHRKQSARYGLKCDSDKVQWGYGYPAEALATSTTAIGKPVSVGREPRAGSPASHQRRKRGAAGCTAAQAGSGGPPGDRNGQYRNGERTKGALRSGRNSAPS